MIVDRGVHTRIRHRLFIICNQRRDRVWTRRNRRFWTTPPLNDPAHHSARDTPRFSHLVKTLAGANLRMHFFLVDEAAPTAEPFPLFSGAIHPGLHAFLDELAFHF